MPPLPRGRRGRTAHRGGRRGGGPHGVCGPPATRAPCAVAYSVNACIQRYTLFIPPRHQPASSLRPRGGSASRTAHWGTGTASAAVRADGAGPPPARRGDARGVISVNNSGDLTIPAAPVRIRVPWYRADPSRNTYRAVRSVTTKPRRRPGPEAETARPSRRGDQRIRGRPNRDRRRRGARATLKRARCPPSERRNQHTRVGKKRRCRARTSPCEQHGTWLWSTPWLRMPTTRNSPPHQWPRRTICASGSRDRAPQSGLRG